MRQRSRSLASSCNDDQTAQNLPLEQAHRSRSFIHWFPAPSKNNVDMPDEFDSGTRERIGRLEYITIKGRYEVDRGSENDFIDYS